MNVIGVIYVFPLFGSAFAADLIILTQLTIEINQTRYNDFYPSRPIYNELSGSLVMCPG